MPRDPRPDLGIPEDQASIEQHVSRITGAATDLDMRLIQIGTWLEDPKDPDSLRPKWSRLTFDGKRKRLAGLLPASWAQGVQLIDGLQAAYRYRNSIDHARVKFRIEGPEHEVTWEFQSLDRQGNRQDHVIDMATLRKWEWRFAVLDYCVSYFVYPGIGFMLKYGRGPEILDMESALHEDERGFAAGHHIDPVEWGAAAGWLFPTPRT